MIIDHIGLSVSDYEKSKAFFTAALAPLRVGLITETHGWAGYGRDGKPEFWFGVGTTPQKPMHVAFVAENRSQVCSFYEAALKAGAKDNGPPGIREIYHPNYYGAFVISPEGHNIEAVCHRDET